jgi:hypothetical protein
MLHGIKRPAPLTEKYEEGRAQLFSVNEDR